MKSIQNKLTEIKMQEENGSELKAEYADLFKLLIKAPKQGGYDYDDMANRIAIEKAINAVKAKTGEESEGIQLPKAIEMEDAPFKYLVDLVKNTKWQFWHQDLLTFKDDVLAVK